MKEFQELQLKLRNMKLSLTNWNKIFFMTKLQNLMKKINYMKNKHL